MYIYCVGAGSPAIVIESGLSSDSLGWYGVQHSLAKVTRVCAYDRSGLGLSEPRPSPRHAETIASELHDLLNKAAIERPFIALGWSAGALYMREYARQFPSDIAAVVLVEPSLPRQLDAIPGARAAYEADRQTLPTQYRWERVRVWTGWERLMGRCWNSPADDVTKVLTTEDASRLANLYVAKTCRPAYVGGEMGEFMDFDTTSAHAGRLPSFGQVPLLIMTKDTETASMTAEDRAEAEAWSREQEALKTLSVRSWRVVARNSGHAIHHDRPELLVAEVARLANFLRGGPAPPFGSTLTE
jgi:pimeloyl-ACP methyl ester carboxylesterase